MSGILIDPLEAMKNLKGKIQRMKISMSKILSLTVSKARGIKETVRNKLYQTGLQKQIREMEKCES